MIRIVLLGRTGNHLFQYALGRVLAERHRVPLVLDASWFNAEGWAEVSHFLHLPIRARVVRPLSLASRGLRKLTGKHYWEFLDCPFLRESAADQSFDQRFLDAPADCVLFGYFQTPRYFETIAVDLRAEFKELLTRAFEKDSGQAHTHPVAKALSQPHSVAVHVRRGDYLQHRAFHVCDDGYYRESMDQMRSLVPGAHFHIFSDDPAWCREAFTGADTTVIDSGADASNPLHDLYLMSLASHHLIANSTYSWWAAWIGEKPGQVVLMPDRWYVDGNIRAPIGEKLGGGHWRKVIR